MTAPADERVCVGRIGAPHGINGEVRLHSFTADPRAIADYGVLQTKDGKRRFEIASLRHAGNTLVARLNGVCDRSAAEALRNLELFIPRSDLPPPDEGEFYHSDLIGLTAITNSGDEIGTIVAIHNFGAGDLLELRVQGRPDTVMVPFTMEAVPLVDLESRRVVIDPPQGLLDRDSGR
jgi:16S rRNA processing protein RimM